MNFKKKFTEEEALQLVKFYGENIKFIKDPSEAVQIESLNTNVNAIQYIENPSEKIQLMVVKNDGLY